MKTSRLSSWWSMVFPPAAGQVVAFPQEVPEIIVPIHDFLGSSKLGAGPSISIASGAAGSTDLTLLLASANDTINLVLAIDVWHDHAGGLELNVSDYWPDTTTYAVVFSPISGGSDPGAGRHNAAMVRYPLGPGHFLSLHGAVGGAEHIYGKVIYLPLKVGEYLKV